MTNKNLIEILTRETESLRIQYIKETEVWANKSFANAVKMAKWRETDWCEYFGLIPVAVNVGKSNEFLSFPRGFYNTREAKIYRNMRDKARGISKTPIADYISNKIKLAEEHYIFSVEKLAFRIEKKGLNIDSLKAVTSHVGVNIETTLTDGVKTVRAFTIIARGEIQCPHYRYLIK